MGQILPGVHRIQPVTVGLVSYPDQNDTLPAHSMVLAAELRRLGHLVVGRTLDPTKAAEITAQLAAIAEQVEQVDEISKIENLGRRNRINHFVETGEWPAAPPNGSRLEFDPASLVGGELNPFSMEAIYHKDGLEVVGTVTLRKCFEGPPTRVHGGAICSIFDEVMGSVFRGNGTASAFTGELTVRFEGPAPLDTELVFRARQVEAVGRKRMLEAEAVGPDGQFASAKGVFIEMKPEHLVTP